MKLEESQKKVSKSNSVVSFHSIDSRQENFSDYNPLKIRVEFSKDHSSRMNELRQDQSLSELHRHIDNASRNENNESSLISKKNQFQLNSESIHGSSLVIDKQVSCVNLQNNEQVVFPFHSNVMEKNTKPFPFNFDDRYSKTPNLDPRDSQLSQQVYENIDSNSRFEQKKALQNGINLCLRTIKKNQSVLSKVHDLDLATYQRLIDDSKQRVSLLKQSIHFRNFLAKSENTIEVKESKKS
jgi:hypothetical protein